MLYVVDLYHLYHQLLKPHAFPRTVASLTKTSFWPVLQASPVYLYVIVQRVKVSLAILSDLNLLPYQTVIIQWRNFDKVICTKYNWTYPKKRNSRRNLILQVFFFFFFFNFRVDLVSWIGYWWIFCEDLFSWISVWSMFYIFWIFCGLSFG